MVLTKKKQEEIKQKLDKNFGFISMTVKNDGGKMKKNKMTVEKKTKNDS